jgi:pilus assembly protein CpaB
MNRRMLTILLLALVLATACSVLVYRIVGKSVGATKAPSTTRVVGAATDLKIGAILTPANITYVEMGGAIPKGAILKAENAVNRGVVSDIYQGEPILENRLAPAGSGGGMAATIPPGMRACAVKVDEVVGVAGFVTPGMRVDVLVSGDPPDNPDPRQGSVVATLLQNIEVLSAGTDIQKDAEGKPQQVHVVNLLVNPEQAESLSLAMAINQLHIQLVLRNPLDTKVQPVRTTAMANLFTGGGPAPAPPVSVRPVTRLKPAPAPQKPVSVVIFNGAQRTEQQFTPPEVKK